MQTDARAIEQPIKYAALAGLVFAGSTFLLGYILEFLAYIFWWH